MRKRWLALALLLGVFAGELTWFWLSGPLWQRTFRFGCRVLGFTPDSRELIIVEVFADAPNPSLPRLLRCDSSTGKILNAVDLPYPDQTAVMGLFMSPDATTLLFCVPGPVVPNKLKGEQPDVYFLHDTRTGSRLAGPIYGDNLGPLTLSADSRWFWIKHFEASGNKEEFDVIEARSGKAILQPRRQNDENPCSLCFASDSSAVAVLWKKKPENAAASSFVQIVDLPNGKERRRLKLPNREWEALPKWVGNRLYAEATYGVPPKYFRQTYSFDLTADSIGDGIEEPLLVTHIDEMNDLTCCWNDGEGWVAHISLGPYRKTKCDELLDWLGRKIGKVFVDDGTYYARIRFLIPDTGHLRYELPAQFAGMCIISPDGKRVTSMFSPVQVWDAYPPPRWPWPTAAGLATAGSVLLFGRWRKRRETRTTFIPPMPAN